MRLSIIVSLFVTLIGATVYWYVATAAVCPVPLLYRLGAYDERFSLEAETVKGIIAEAEAAWEAAANRELFIYDEKADFVIDFVFDERQRRAMSQGESQALLDEKEERMKTARATIDTLQARYTKLKDGYEARARTYERNLARYNGAVEAVNARGGADESERARLQTEQASLVAEAEALDGMARDLNTLIADINTLGEESNALVADYNKDVARYNDAYGEAGAFTQGQFSGDRITIYKYSDATELRQVMAHEFGHALGIGHVEDPQAILYYLLEQQPDELRLMPADVAAFELVCGKGDEFEHRMRRLIRSALSLLI